MAHFINNFVDEYNKRARPFKVKLFEELNEMTGSQNEKLKILEVGAGSGANFEYYKMPASIQVVEPNANFAEMIDKNKKKFPSLEVEFFQGYGEDLESAGIEKESVDAVVITLVLCSVQDQIKCLKEIHRVLKPGGKFFYMEHIIAPPSDWARILHQVFTESGFWSFLFDNCHLNREAPDVLQDKLHWSSVEETKYYMPPTEDSIMLKAITTLISSHVMGVLKK